MTQLEIKREAVRRPLDAAGSPARSPDRTRRLSITKDTKLLSATRLSEARSFRPASLLFQRRNSVNWPLPSSAPAFWH